MFKLSLHADAKTDLKAIQAADPTTAATLLIFLQELKNDQDLLDRLTQHGYTYENGHWLDNIDVQKVVSQHEQGRNLWRLKLWDLEHEGIQYRVIYAFTPLTRTVHVLGVIHRKNFNYEPDHTFTKRVVAAYRDL